MQWNVQKDQNKARQNQNKKKSKQKQTIINLLHSIKHSIRCRFKTSIRMFIRMEPPRKQFEGISDFVGGCLEEQNSIKNVNNSLLQKSYKPLWKH